MTHRQTRPPRQWLIAGERLGAEFWRAVRVLPRGSGILVLRDEPGGRERRLLLRRLRRLASRRGLTIADEAQGAAARVHNPGELRQALLARTPLILLSPLYPTRSHPDWQPLPRMRAAALARLGRRRVVALGGMDANRFRRVERLGFQAWAGIDAWLEAQRTSRG